MGTFNPVAFRDKLTGLNSSQASIETLSSWCQFFRKQAGSVVGAWDQEYTKAPPPRRLIMLYLANDIIQNSRRKGPEFVTEFYKIIPRALKHSLRHFDDVTLNRVTRLVSVWDERKVFGMHGTRALKEAMADAETPKRGLSARTGGPSPADTQSDPGAYTPRGQPLPAQLRPLAAALAASSEAGARSSALVERCSAVLQKGLLEQGGMSEVQGAAHLLQDYASALSTEGKALDDALAALQTLTAQQSEARQRVRDQESVAARQLQAFNGRLAQLTGQPQPPVSSSASVAALHQRPASSTPPLPASVAPPLPAMSAAAGQPPLATSGSMPTAASSPFPASTPHPQNGVSAAMQAPPPIFGAAEAPPPLFGTAAGSSGAVPPLPSEPPPASGSGDIDMQPVSAGPPSTSEGQQFTPPLPSSTDAFAQSLVQQHTDDEAAAAAAALVAQLSAANNSKALLEALAALPQANTVEHLQDQQREISLSFLQSSGGSGAAAGLGDQEEYNPEDPGF